MRSEQIAVTLYTTREYCKDARSFASTCARIREIGYQAVQLSGLGDISETDIVRILDSEGLRCCATHEKGAMILEQPERVADRLCALGCRYTAFPHPGKDIDSLETVMALAQRLDKAGAVLRERGLVLTYHNHALEFRRLEGRPALEIIYESTDPRNVHAEPDTYWIQAGGGDVVRWCERLAGRMPLLHLKDYAVDNFNQPTFAEIGNGNLDWPRIIAAAETSGCEWFIVEQDRGWIDNDPFKSLEISFGYLTSRLC